MYGWRGIGLRQRVQLVEAGDEDEGEEAVVLQGQLSFKRLRGLPWQDAIKYRRVGE